VSIRRLVLAAEASAATGLGHFVRCCALGDAAQRRGWGVTVLLRPDAVQWARTQVAARGWTLASGDLDPSDLGRVVRQSDSMDQTALVIDSYLVDENTISRMRDGCGRLVVVDDVADRLLDADVVVNQNLGAADLPVRLGAGTVLLAGPTYALLRPEFPALRPAALDGVNALPEVPGRILVMMGGTDPTGSAPTVARACLTAFPMASVAVVLPGRAGVRTVGRLTELPRLEHVAQHMMEADLVVTATGSTIWELSCLARPVAALEMASNQSDVYRRLVAGGLVLGLGRPPVNEADLVTSLQSLTGMPGELRRLATAAAGLVDGCGADRVLDHTEGSIIPPRTKEIE
jgi:UDP-2,4-diacetamido-2,4,6-trideoxy-beta-L-altropyranose hydrolase